MFYKSTTKASIKYIQQHTVITKHFNHFDPTTKKNEKWVEVKVPREPTKVLNRIVRVTHVYDVPVKLLKKPSMYFDPIFTSHYDNTKHDFLAYRKKLGLMPTKVIIKKRKQYHLTQKQMAKVLGINPVHYHMIENGSLTREKEWYKHLYMLTNPHQMQYLIKQRLN